ncbi:hypothetical protein RCL1_008784 [Eukaryota sp. TZLM3-RCL]
MSITFPNSIVNLSASVRHPQLKSVLPPYPCCSFLVIPYHGNSHLTSLIVSAVKSQHSSLQDQNRFPLGLEFLLLLAVHDFLEVIDLQTGVLLKRFTFPTAIIKLAALFRTPTLYVAVGFQRGDVTIFSPFDKSDYLHFNTSGSIIRHPVTFLAFNESFNLLVSFADGSIHEFNPSLKKCSSWDEGGVNLVSPYFLIRSQKSSMCNPISRYCLSHRSVTCFDLCSFNKVRLLYSVSSDGCCKAIDVESGHLLYEHKTFSSLKSVKISNDGLAVVVGTEADEILLLNRECSLLARLTGHCNWPRSMAFLPTRELEYLLVSVDLAGILLFYTFSIRNGTVQHGQDVALVGNNDGVDGLGLGFPTVSPVARFEAEEALSEVKVVGGFVIATSLSGNVFLWSVAEIVEHCFGCNVSM